MLKYDSQIINHDAFTYFNQVYATVAQNTERWTVEV